jgi:HEAT repeat protein
MKRQYIFLLVIVCITLIGCIVYLKFVSNKTKVTDNEAGKAIKAYLTCLDLDCSESLNQIRLINKQAVPLLIDLLDHGSSQGVSDLPKPLPIGRIIIALGALQDVKAIPAITKFLNHSDPVIRATAASALGNIGQSDTVQSLIPLLKDQDYYVRESTALSLEKIGQKEALPSLKQALSIENQSVVRDAIQKAIQTLEEK